MLAATNKDLAQEIARGAFREDLYYRLNVVAIAAAAAARARATTWWCWPAGSSPSQAREYASRARGFTPGALVALRRYAWPGNVRELENRVKKAVVLAEKGLVSAPRTSTSRPEVLEPTQPLTQATREFQRRYVNEVLDRNGGNRTKTAKDLGVDPRTIFRHLERMEAERRGEPPPPEEEAP